MTDDIVKNIYDKKIKNWIKKSWKFLLTILIYILYQENFLISILNDLGFKISSLSKNIKIIALIINDSIYAVTVILLFKKEIINGLKDLKKNFTSRILISVNCWLLGCIIMSLSSIIIDLISGQSVSNNESLVRQSITIAPLYMLFTCSVIAPILEEMVFRNSLHGLIKKKWIFIIISGLCFGLLHVISSYKTAFDLLYIIPYGAMGCCFAYLLTKTENITLPILIHMIHNSILVLVQILRK